MILKGRKISKGEAQGYVLRIDALSFLGGVDLKGKIIDEKNSGFGKNIQGKILVFPHGKGSTVGSYVLYGLKRRGFAPKAIVNEESEPIVAVGAIISEIPMVDKIDISKLKEEDKILVDADEALVERL
ncbi:MAG: DUF126 domain-containing protein [Candidatus Methanofastidiosia archaeon]